MTFGLVSKSVPQSHYKVIFTKIGKKDIARNMKSTSMVNLRKNIIATGLLSKLPTALIYTAKGAFVGSVKKESSVYIWQGVGDNPYRCKADGRLILKAAKPKKTVPKVRKTVPKVSKPKVVPKLTRTFGNEFLDEHIVIASIPRYKGRV